MSAYLNKTKGEMGIILKCKKILLKKYHSHKSIKKKNLLKRNQMNRGLHV